MAKAVRLVTCELQDLFGLFGEFDGQERDSLPELRNEAQRLHRRIGWSGQTRQIAGKLFREILQYQSNNVPEEQLV